MAVLTTKQRKALPKSDFAIPEKAPGPGSYPLPDKSHGEIALGMVGAHGTPEEKARVRAKVHTKFPGIGKKPGRYRVPEKD